VITDTIPLKEENPKIRVISPAELSARTINNVVLHESINALFL